MFIVSFKIENIDILTRSHDDDCDNFEVATGPLADPKNSFFSFTRPHNGRIVIL